jgi:hypothetical protein
VLAHRVAWFLSRGEWPTAQVCHACDAGQEGCVRADHLFAGTQTANMSDCAAKERGSNKLTEIQARDIIALAAAGALQKDLAARFGVVPATISYIVRRVTWKHIP